MILAGILSIPKKVTTLRYVATGTIISLCYITLVVMIEAPYRIASHESIADSINYMKFDLSGCHSISIMIFAYSNITLLPTIYRELNNRSYKEGLKPLIEDSLLQPFSI